MEYVRTVEQSKTSVWKVHGGPEGIDAGRDRVLEIQRAVRDAIAMLLPMEREVIEGYYFDGLSLQRIADEAGRPLSRIRLLHQRALRKLEIILAPFVARMFGVKVLRVPDCPICRAGWRVDAERILDDKSDDITWGLIARRIERATGWRAPNPQTLKTHQLRHRKFLRDGKGESE